MRARTVVLVVVAGMTVVAGAAAVRSVGDAAILEPGLPSWPGPVHLDPGAPLVALQPDGPDAVEYMSADGPDAVPRWVDIERVRMSPSGQIHWRIDLAEKAPIAERLADAGSLLTYGLVLESTGDGVADFVIGISNDAPRRGQFRVWVTDLATDETREQVGAPYGSLVEFRHPDEQEVGEPPSMVFTFIGRSMPRGITSTSQWYAWAALTNADGDVVAWDYSPDAAWLTVPPGWKDLTLQ